MKFERIAVSGVLAEGQEGLTVIGPSSLLENHENVLLQKEGTRQKVDQ